MEQASITKTMPDLAEGIDVPLKFTFVVGRLVFMDDSLGGQAVEIRLDLAQNLLRLRRIFSLTQRFHHRPHPAAMKAVAGTPLGILPDAFGG